MCLTLKYPVDFNGTNHTLGYKRMSPNEDSQLCWGVPEQMIHFTGWHSCHQLSTSSGPYCSWGAILQDNCKQGNPLSHPNLGCTSVNGGTTQGHKNVLCVSKESPARQFLGCASVSREPAVFTMGISILLGAHLCKQGEPGQAPPGLQGPSPVYPKKDSSVWRISPWRPVAVQECRQLWTPTIKQTDTCCKKSSTILYHLYIVATNSVVRQEVWMSVC